MFKTNNKSNITSTSSNFICCIFRWWGLVEKSWNISQNYPRELPFYSNFDQVSTSHVYLFARSLYLLLHTFNFNNASLN